MTTAWVVRQGRGGQFAEEMIQAGYLGVDFIGDYDIRPHLGGKAEAFRGAMNSVYLGMYPEKTKVAAGLAMGNLWAASEGIAEGDLVLAPKPDRTYQYGIVTGGYEYHPGTELPHRRPVDWKGSINRDDMSPTLASTASVPMTVFQRRRGHHRAGGRPADPTGPVHDTEHPVYEVPGRIPSGARSRVGD